MAMYAYYCLHKLHRFPGEFDNLPSYEKAFVCAAIDHRVKKEKEEAQKLKSKR